MTITNILDTIRAGTYTFTTEDQLQAGIATQLESAHYTPVREVRLTGDLGRVDLMVGGVAIEVKTKGNWQALARQIMRYAHAPEVKSIIVVTTKATHLGVLPGLVETDHGTKLVTTVFINGAF